ncbi:MAG: heavy-metal-associated domain-containing protein, partial [Porphyrobacter sp.]|nr:heavy-metal-associated domain-containing protein [Porphyrobacter sp.]
VRDVATRSVAIGGTSVLRVSFAGDLATLAGELRARGWQVTEGANALAIAR